MDSSKHYPPRSWPECSRITYSSVSEIGLTIFTASLAALRPLLTYLVTKSLHSNSDGTADNSKSKGWRMELRDLNPPVSLHDRPASDTESQIDILPRNGRIVKHTSFEVKYSEAQKF